MNDARVNRRHLVEAGGSVAGLGLLGGCTRLSGGTARFAAKPAASWWHARCPQNFAVANILRGGTVPASSVATETFDEPPPLERLVGAGYQGFVSDLAVTEPLREAGPSKAEGKAAVTLAGGRRTQPGATEDADIRAHAIGQRVDHADDAVVLAGWMNERDEDLWRTSSETSRSSRPGRPRRTDLDRSSLPKRVPRAVGPSSRI